MLSLNLVWSLYKKERANLNKKLVGLGIADC